MAFQVTPAHQAIFDAIKDDNGGNLIIEAVAGAGKTSTIVEALKLIPPEKKVLFLAFNASIVTELKARVPSHVDVMTLNGLGWRAYLAHAKDAGIKVKDPDTKKLVTLARDLFSPAEFGRFGSNACKLVAKAKTVGLLPDRVEWKAEGLMPDVMASWAWLANRFDIDCEDNLAETVEAAQHLYRKSCTTLNVLDFDDQLLLPFGLGLSLPRMDWTFVDELQDLSPLNLALVKRIVKRFCGVGDPHQSIYAFRGADSDSMAKCAEVFACKSFPLHVSYRCAQAIVREAQTVVSHIKAHDGAPEGEVHTTPKPLEECDVKPGDFVLCRLSAPVVQAAYSLLRAGIPAVVRGRDIGTGLVRLLEKLKATSIDDAQSRLNKWEEAEIKKAKDDEAKQASAMDRAETLRLFLNMSDSLDDFRARIERMFSNDNNEGVVVCSTIHKAKGLEAERVFLIDRDKMPHKSARQPWQIQQEMNLIYVAITRAKRFLQYVTLTGTIPKKQAKPGADEPWKEIGGNTYPVKDELKRLGCRWDAAKKVWLCPPEHAKKATALVGQRRY